MPSFYSENNQVLPSDDSMRTLHKIASLSGAGSGGSAGTGGSAGRQVYTGASPPAAPDNPAIGAVFYPDGGGSMQNWNVPTQAWL